MGETVCIKHRFCWKKQAFPGWEKILPEDGSFVLTFYHELTPPFLVGCKDRYFEVISRKELLEKYPDATYIRREAGSYCVQSERHSLTHYPTIDQALMKLLQREKAFDMDPSMPYSAFDVPEEQMWNIEPFIPDALYVPGNGILDEVMRSGDSVAIILPFWHPKKSPEENRNGLGRWYHYFYYDREVRREKRRKWVSRALRYKVKFIALRCGGVCDDESFPATTYSLADYRADGLCLLLDPKTSTDSNVEAFYNDYTKWGRIFGLKSILYKKKNMFFSIDLQDPQRCKPVHGMGMKVLFDFLTDLYNSEKSPQTADFRVPLIDEEIDRSDVPRCGSFVGAMAYHQKSFPVRRSQWHRFDCPGDGVKL